MKKKILLTIASQLEDIKDEDFMSTSSQTAYEKNAPLIDVDGAIINEGNYLKNDIKCVHLNSENMEAHKGQWLNYLYHSSSSKDDKGKGKGHANVV